MIQGRIQSALYSEGLKMRMDSDGVSPLLRDTELTRSWTDAVLLLALLLIPLKGINPGSNSTN
jgi:hypothetical protein